jgi:hypothetical protein
MTPGRFRAWFIVKDAAYRWPGRSRRYKGLARQVEQEALSPLSPACPGARLEDPAGRSAGGGYDQSPSGFVEIQPASKGTDLDHPINPPVQPRI